MVWHKMGLRQDHNDLRNTNQMTSKLMEIFSWTSEVLNFSKDVSDNIKVFQKVRLYEELEAHLKNHWYLIFLNELGKSWKNGWLSSTFSFRCMKFCLLVIISDSKK